MKLCKLLLKSKGPVPHSPKVPVSNAPGWNEETASDSEAMVKADRSPAISVEELQHKTEEKVYEAKMEEEIDETLVEEYSVYRDKAHQEWANSCKNNSFRQTDDVNWEDIE